ncbi:hypothetical protein MSG28_014058 [Choristoneura fumiferana]|uniref:Uncharacterized protein n=1 Tax=Choristoneura fumiferana TaxID=7141 RepID=A0ACC0JFW7_CHOFU|nr:hypothetical protein MSG28_014058 [Choristoneura fumiferana]
MGLSGAHKLRVSRWPAKAVKGKAQTPAPLKTPPTKALKIVTPRTAAVVLTIKEGATISYSEVLVKARTSIKLADVGLESVKVRTTMTGSKMLEVGGENPEASADRLAEKLQAAVGDSVDVTRPTKLAELKISGMDETVSREEIAGVLAAIGRCTPEVVKVGTIRAGPWGQASALIRCPAVAAKAIAKEGKVVLGWSTATIKPVEALPMRCYKCMALGHTRALCPSEADHGAKCFRCGKEGHLAAACEATPKCAVCAQAGRSHAHVMGGPKCCPPRSKVRPPRPGPYPTVAASWPTYDLTYLVPSHPNWVGDTEGSVGVVVPTAGLHRLSLRERGAGYTAANWGEVVIIGVYFSPNRPFREFERFLGALEPVVRRASPSQVVLMGDFNAKCAAWGSPVTDTRGALLRDWAASVGLVLQNIGRADTCVRQQGGSIVDLTFTTPAIGARVSQWRVLEEMETLSDHLYIRCRISKAPLGSRARVADGRGGAFPRWVLSRLDRDRAEEAAVVQAWAADPPQSLGVEERAVKFRRDLTAICNAGMPRAKKFAPREGVYWWSQDLADLRIASDAARRAFTRCRRRRIRLPGEEERLLEALRAAKKAFSAAISRAKDAAYTEFLSTLDAYPWDARTEWCGQN